MTKLLTLMLFLLPLAGCAILGGGDSQSVMKPAVVSGPEWGSEPAEFPASYVHTPRQVLIHHAGVAWKEGDDPAVKIKALQGWGYRERDWMDVPYHFMIAPDGRIFEGRAVTYKPDTNTDFDTTGYINLQLWGNFEEQRVSEAQLAATAQLTAWLIDEYDLTPELLTHFDAAPGQTSCPGKDFYQYMQAGVFPDWVAKFRAGSSPQIALLPPLEGGPEEMIPGAK